MSAAPLDPGLQRERTSLAWTRTALGLFGNAVLVLVRHETAFPLPVSAALALLTLLVAGLALVHARARSRLPVLPDGEIRAGYGRAVSLGVAMTVLCGCFVVAIAVWR